MDIKKVFNKISSPKGKINRLDFIIGYVVMILLLISTGFFIQNSGLPLIFDSVVVVSILFFAFLYLFVVNHLKRFRDLQWSPFVLILVLIFNPFVSIIMCFIPGKSK